MRRLGALLVAAAVLLVPHAAIAVRAGSIHEKLRCPTCRTTLDVSNAPVAVQMKQRIDQRLAQGATEQQIIDEFVQEFGPTVLATPDTSGFDLLAWLVPGLAVAAGLATIPFVVRAWARRRPGTLAAPAPLSDEDARRLQQELDAFRDE